MTVGRRGPRGSTGSPIGSTSEAVANHADGAVVVEIDGTADGLHVVDYAIREAQRAGVELVLVRPYRGDATTSGGTSSAHEQADGELRTARAHVRRQVGYQIPVRAIPREGSRTAVLTQLSRSAALLVVPRRRARGHQRLMAAQADLLLAGLSTCPVVVVPRPWKPVGSNCDVTVGMDGTRRSWDAVGHAFAAAARQGGRLVVVNTQRGPPRPVSHDAEPARANAAEPVMAETFADCRDKYPAVTVERVPSSGSVALALTRYSAHAGLLVLGVHAGRDRLVADPVVREALAAATSPVVLVQHFAVPYELTRVATV